MENVWVGTPDEAALLLELLASEEEPILFGDFTRDCEKLTPPPFMLKVNVVTGSWLLSCCLIGDISGVFLSSSVPAEPSPPPDEIELGGGNENEYFFGWVGCGGGGG